jgi:hypothetical protein
MKEYSVVLLERRDDGKFVLSQRQYLLNVLQRFGIKECKTCATPRVLKKAIDGAIAETSYATSSYREAVGSLLHLSTNTRPDISFTVGMLGHAMATPSAQDIVTVKRLIRYLSGTRYCGLVLVGGGDSTLVEYSDADWGDDIHHKSASGALHFVGYDHVH